MMSPSGDSTLITSAPRSPRICVASGPSTTVVRSSTLIPASGPGLGVLTAASGSCIARFRTLPRARPAPEEEDDAGDDVPQPALQHLAQDPGAAARKGSRADHHRIFEDALYSGTVEAASRPAQDAGTQARAKERSRCRRHRPGSVVRGCAGRGDGQEPDDHRAADRGLGAKGRARSPAGSGAVGSLTTPQGGVCAEYSAAQNVPPW